MIAPEGQERRADGKSNLLEQLHNPSRLRALLTIAVLATGYSAVYLPLNGSTSSAVRKLGESEQRLSLANDVERLRNRFRQVERRLPKNADMDEWVQYILAAIRRSPLKLESFSPGVMKALGPYQMIQLTIKLTGSLADLDQFLHWLESNERLFRVENVSLAPKAPLDKGEIYMEITILGVMG